METVTKHAEVVFNTPDLLPNVLIPVSAILAILFALFLTRRTAQVKVKSTRSSVRTENGREYLLQVSISSLLAYSHSISKADGRS
jgi:hypothetical protein